MKKCVSDQKVTLKLDEREISFYDGHVTKKRKCVGKPCELLQHAELRMVVYCARRGIGIKGARVELNRVPCLPCARILAETGLKHILMTTEPKEKEQEEAVELLAVRVATTIEEKENGSDSGSAAGTGTVKRKPRRRKGSAKKAS